MMPQLQPCGCQTVATGLKKPPLEKNLGTALLTGFPEPSVAVRGPEKEKDFFLNFPQQRVVTGSLERFSSSGIINRQGAIRA